MKNKHDEEMKMKEEERKHPLRADKAIGREYECGKCCRLCPFPGLKCVMDQSTWEHIK